ncbi:MAG: hypothetical protein FWG58_02640, partial [Methanomassiliicoccaceae archaeon]|nr:hypothetical protein [Methanomassiliicoccaceae archaeon]
MKKNQIIAVAVAVMLVAVCAIGVIMFMNNDNEGNSESGILLSYGKYDNEWVEMDTEGLTVNDAFNEALGSDTLGTNEPDPSEWTLWTASGNAKDWTKNTTGDWNTMKVRDFRVIAFSETDEKPILPT